MKIWHTSCQHQGAALLHLSLSERVTVSETCVTKKMSKHVQMAECSSSGCTGPY